MNEKKINDVEELQRKVRSDLPKITGITDVASKSSFQRKALIRRSSKKVALTDADDYEAAELPTMSSRRKSTTYVLEEKKELLNSEVVREVKPKKSTKKKRVKKGEKLFLYFWLSSCASLRFIVLQKWVFGVTRTMIVNNKWKMFAIS